MTSWGIQYCLATTPEGGIKFAKQNRGPDTGIVRNEHKKTPIIIRGLYGYEKGELGVIVYIHNKGCYYKEQ